jgi:hypothetical protein
MLTLTIHNDGTGDETTGHYTVTARINDTVLATGRLEGFERAKGWRACLLEAIATLKSQNRVLDALEKYLASSRDT